MRILVIEDQPDLRAGIVQALRKQGYAVDAAVAAFSVHLPPT